MHNVDGHLGEAIIAYMSSQTANNDKGNNIDAIKPLSAEQQLNQSVLWGKVYSRFIRALVPAMIIASSQMLLKDSPMPVRRLSAEFNGMNMTAFSGIPEESELSVAIASTTTTATGTGTGATGDKKGNAAAKYAVVTVATAGDENKKIPEWQKRNASQNAITTNVPKF